MSDGAASLRRATALGGVPGERHLLHDGVVPLADVFP